MKIYSPSRAEEKRGASRVLAESWKAAYRGIVPQSYLDSLSEDRWLPVFENGRFQTLIAAQNNTVIGAAVFCGAREKEMREFGEIAAIYVLPRFMGQGVGTALLNAAAETLRAKTRGIYLWVLEENFRARRFYEKFGFLFSGKSLCTDIGGKTLRELMYSIFPQII